MSKKTTKRLIYPGVGYDDAFLNILDGYSNYVCYDTLPYYSHYKPGQRGYPPTKSKSCFFRKLRKTFGTYEKQDDGVLSFAKHNMTYHYSTNAELHAELSEIPHGDVLIRGYMPLSRQWLDVFHDPNRVIYASCDTDLSHLDENGVDTEIVHFCGDGYCFYDSD